jgi:hypothetical protein
MGDGFPTSGPKAFGNERSHFDLPAIPVAGEPIRPLAIEGLQSPRGTQFLFSFVNFDPSNVKLYMKPF